MDVSTFVAVVLGALGLAWLRNYIKGGRCRSQARLDGKTAVVTGCNTGIGKETALELCRRGAKVAMACRNLGKTEKAAQYIRSRCPGAKVVIYHLDLSSLKSVADCAKDINETEGRIDILINNAGVMLVPYAKTEDGLEMHMAVNHFGHFLFTNLLLDKIKASAPARIVTVSAKLHEFANLDLSDLNYENRQFSSFRGYCQSKLANILFTKELARRLKGTGVTTYCLHPGVIRTELLRYVEHRLGPLIHVARLLALFFLKSPNDGAQTTVFCAADESISKQTGLYYVDCEEHGVHSTAMDADLAKRLWDISLDTTGLEVQDNN